MTGCSSLALASPSGSNIATAVTMTQLALVMARPSIGQNHVRQHRVVQRMVGAEQALEAGAGSECCTGKAHDHVLGEVRSPRPRDGCIGADAAADVRLLAQRFQRRGVVEPQLVEVAGYARLRRDVEIRADAEQAQAGVVEIRLAERARRAQV